MRGAPPAESRRFPTGICISKLRKLNHPWALTPKLWFPIRFLLDKVKQSILIKSERLKKWWWISILAGSEDCHQNYSPLLKFEESQIWPRNLSFPGWPDVNDSVHLCTSLCQSSQWIAVTVYNLPTKKSYKSIKHQDLNMDPFIYRTFSEIADLKYIGWEDPEVQSFARHFLGEKVFSAKPATICDSNREPIH